MFKPCKQAEISFYESAVAHHPEFVTYIPNFMGTLSLVSEKDSVVAKAPALNQSSTPDQSPALQQVSDEILKDNVWSPSGGGKIKTETAIVLENVAERYQKPNILDLKLGAQLWAEDAPSAKREKLDRVAAETTSKALGIRIAGMRIWQGTEQSEQEGPLADGYRAYDKNYGRSLTSETIRQGFETFFRIKKGDVLNKRIRRVIRRFLDDLEGLQSVLEKEESRMYSSSLLFVYEGDDTALKEAFLAEKKLLASLEEDLLPTEGSKSDQNHFSDADPQPECLPNPSQTTNPPNPAAISHRRTSSACLTLAPSDSSSSSEVDEPTKLPRIQALKLIDFAHADWTPGLGPDQNILVGIKSVIRILYELL